jgi:hypothetical protein
MATPYSIVSQFGYQPTGRLSQRGCSGTFLRSSDKRLLHGWLAFLILTAIMFGPDLLASAASVRSSHTGK